MVALYVKNVSTAHTDETGVVSGSVGGKSLIKVMDKKETKKKWELIEDEETDKIKNRPAWSKEKERDKIVFEPAPPNPLEDWLNKK